MTQDTSDEIGSATMIETHVLWNIADFTLTGLYARWDIDVAATAPADKDKETQDGAYIEASYKFILNGEYLSVRISGIMAVPVTQKEHRQMSV